MAEFDPQAIIRKLAEAEWECAYEKYHKIVPFASLRVACDNHGWIPEPDVEKACWRVYKVLWGASSLITYHGGRVDMTDEEAILSAASAWLDERMKEAANG